MPLSEDDLKEIDRISGKKSVRKVSKTLLKDLDNRTLSLLIASYIVLKAKGHTDADFVKYVSRRSTALKLGVMAGASIAPRLIVDREFRSLLAKTSKELNKKKKPS